MSYIIDQGNKQGYCAKVIQQRSSEDRISIKFGNQYRLFAIFDGHGSANSENSEDFNKHVVNKLHTSFLDYILDNLIKREENGKIGKNLSNLFIKLILDYDKMLFKEKYMHGSCCTMVCIDDKVGKIYQINLGDSKSILYNNDTIISSTTCHDFDDVNEVKRVKEPYFVFMNRINATLVVSRAFGDFEFKLDREKYSIEIGVSCIPEIKVFDKDAVNEILLMSDAILDNRNITDQHIVDACNKFYMSEAKVDDLISKTKVYSNDDISFIHVKV